MARKKVEVGIELVIEATVSLDRPAPHCTNPDAAAFSDPGEGPRVLTVALESDNQQAGPSIEAQVFQIVRTAIQDGRFDEALIRRAQKEADDDA